MPVSEVTDPINVFLQVIADGKVDDCEVWADDVRLDATVPNWRFVREGLPAVRAEYASWFRDPARLHDVKRVVIEGGEVVEYLISWEQDGIPHAAHHLHVLLVDGAHITDDTVMCGGRWSASLLAQMGSANG